MSKVFQKGDNIVLYVPLSDEVSLGFPIKSASYSIYDMDGNTVVDDKDLPVGNISTDEFNTEIIVDIPPFPTSDLPTINTSPRAFFRVSLTFTSESDFVHQHIDEFYLEDILTDLNPPYNAFGTYGLIMTLAGSRADMDVFLHADFDVRMSALNQAFEDIKSLPLIITRVNKGIDEIYPIIPSMVNATLTLSNEEKRILSLAQLQQANYILGGYAAEDLRRIGIRQKVAGASSTLYQAGKVLPIVVCNAAQNTLRPYFAWKVKLTRT